MQLSSRFIRSATAGGICDRTRLWAGGVAQPAPSAPSFDSVELRSGVRFVPVRGQTRRRRTVVHRAGSRYQLLDRPVSTAGDVGVERQFPSPARSCGDDGFGDRRGRVGRLATSAVISYQRVTEGRLSPCRFTPTCSAFALDALERHGTARGLLLTLRRLVRCRPFGPSGWDPVPDAPTRKRLTPS